MSGQLRSAGLSLRIDGGEEFQRTLDAASSAMRRNGEEMKKLEATYGRGSSDTDYLSQKSQLLSRQLEEQQRKTQALRQVRAQYAAGANADAAKLEKLDLQILKAETSEAGLARQLRECDEALSKQARETEEAARREEQLAKEAEDAARGQDALGKATEAAGKKAADSAGRWDTLQKKLDSTGKSMERAGKRMTTLLTAPIVGMGTAALTFAVGFEDALYEVATLPGVVSGAMEEQAAQLDAYGDALLTASDKTHTAAADLAKAQYEIISAGISPEDSVYWAERAAMAAKAGRTDASTVVSGASSMYNAWGAAGSGGLDHILDAMMVAQNRGKTSVGEIAGSIGQVTGLAPQLGVGMDEALSAVAAMTLSGVQTSSAITSLRGAMASVIKPTAEAAKEAERLGLDFSAAALSAQGLTGFLQSVMTATEGDTESLGKLFGSVEGLNGVMMLGTTAAADYADILSEMQGADGVMEAAFDTRTSSRAEQLSGALNRLKNSGITLAENLTPAVDTVTDLIGGVADVVGSLDEGGQKALLTVLGVTAAIGPATSAVGKLLPLMGKLGTFLTSPAGGVALGVAGIGALTYAVYKAVDASDELARASDSISLSADPESVARITASIDAGIDAAKKEHHIAVGVLVNPDQVQQDIQTQFDAMMADGRVDKAEYTATVRFLDATVVEEASAVLADDPDNPVAQELLAAETEYQGLLEALYTSRRTATEEELAALEAALGRIKALRAEMQGMVSDLDKEEIDRAQISYAQVASGYGSETTLGNAIGYVVGQQMVRQEEETRAADARDAAYQQRLDSAATDAQREQARLAYEAEGDQLAAQAEAGQLETQRQLQTLLDGWAMATEENRESADALSRAADAIELLNLMETPGLDMTQSERGMALMAQFGISSVMWSPSLNYNPVAWGQREQDKKLLASVAAGASLEGSPLQSALQSAIDAGINVDALDTSQMEGVLADLMRVTLYQEGAENLGTEAMGQIGAGITEALPEAEEAAGEAAASISARLTPAAEQYDVGYDAALSIGQGLRTAAPYTVAQASALAADVNAALNSIVPPQLSPTPGAGLTQGPVAGGGGVSISTNVNVQNATLRSPTDLSVLSNQISAETRRNMGAVGVSVNMP